jgi:methylenetetrahydrofolate reductase (NADPH)
MTQEKSQLLKRLESGKQVVLAEITPPQAPDAAFIRAVAKAFAGKVHALGVCDNREAVQMSALAAASIMVFEGMEPVLHMATRDRNRTALISDSIGAQAMGIHNILCTSGTHQSLLPFHAAKNVYDVDATILLQSLRGLDKNASIVGEKNIPGQTPLCLGAVASPNADPLELQMPRLAQKIFAGAQFVVTQPVFDFNRFDLWWKEVTNRGLQTKAAFIAGIKVLTDIESAKAYAEKRPTPMVPEEVIKRLASKSDKNACRKEGIKIALESMERLSAMPGLRGFEINCNGDREAALEVLDSLKSNIG